jgi:hypothetical protein
MPFVNLIHSLESSSILASIEFDLMRTFGEGDCIERSFRATEARTIILQQPPAGREPMLKAKPRPMVQPHKDSSNTKGTLATPVT